MNVYKLKVSYGRGEMTMKCLVAAPDEKTARKLGNDAAPVPVMNLKNDIKCDLLLLLDYTGPAPQVICIL